MSGNRIAWPELWVAALQALIHGAEERHVGAEARVPGGEVKLLSFGMRRRNQIQRDLVNLRKNAGRAGVTGDHQVPST